MSNSADWRGFATALAKLANSQGKPEFLDEAFIFLNQYVKVDSCAVFKISTDKISGADHLCTFGVLRSEIADRLASNYIRTGFQKDPIIQTALISTSSRVRHIPNTFYPPAYQGEYFKSSGLIDKITSLHTSGNALYSINFYRLKKSGAFQVSDYRDLERLAPVLSRFVVRHTRTIDKNSSLVTPVLNIIIDKIIDDSSQIFVKLSDRERVVCKNILLGLDEPEIARKLNLSASTIKTHRKRAYSKLDISTKVELFQLTLMNNH